MSPEFYTAVMVPTSETQMTTIETERRPLPTTTIQAAGQAVGDVTEGLGRTPLMLGIVVLNIAGILAAVYFLNVLIVGSMKHTNELLDIQTAHLEKILAVHNREFDALMDLAARLELAARNPGAPPPAPAPPAPTPPRR